MDVIAPRHVILHVSLIQKLSPIIAHALIVQFNESSLLRIYEYSIADFIACGIDEESAQLLYRGLLDRSMLEKELVLMDRHAVGWVTILDSEYPKLLKEIHIPPLVLYYKGNVSLLSYPKILACVGSRKAHRYTQQALEHIVLPLLQDDWCVVSGGALGADTLAHQMALDYNKPTIVVVGSGFLYTYPAVNKLLFDKIVVSGGLIVSCFAMATEPMAWCFPVRNRIIAGLSLGSFVLQAASKSGALITAEYALEQGRQVFALPGSIFDPLSAGCHALIKDGAVLVESSDDILREFGYMFQHKDRKAQKTIFKHAVALEHFDPIVSAVLDGCATPVTADQLMTKLNIDLPALQSTLFDLSLDNKVVQDALGFWQRV